MKQTLKSLGATAIVLSSAGAILVGAVMRDRVDVGGANDTMLVSGLIASRDKSEVPEGDYFYEITNLLKQRYVERVDDEQKLALGAIRGMVSSLGDPDSVYMEKAVFQAHQAMRSGEFEGIGAQLELVYTEPRKKEERIPGQPLAPEEALVSGIRIPKLTVVSIVPGGPADKAGVQVGDYVEYVDDHWVPNAETIASFRKLQQDFANGKVEWEEISRVRQELTKRTKKTVLPLKAREKLIVGKEGTVRVTWRRGSQSLNTNITMGTSRLPGFSDVDGVIQMRFAPGAADALRDAIGDKDQVVIDLRNNANGLANPMLACLEVLLPKGKHGELKIGERTVPIEVKNGTDKPRQITLLVDKSTRGAAEVFADVLTKAGVAKATGGETAGHPILVEDYELPDGSGYSLAVAAYLEGSK